MGTNEMTNEGVRVGELLLGAINDNSPVMLWTVTRVIGKSKVEAVAATREFELSYDHQMLRVRYVPSEESIAGLKRLGSLVKR
jgi:hypothetical protein